MSPIRSDQARRTVRLPARSIAIVFVALLGGCATSRPVQIEPVKGLGHFDYRGPMPPMEGTVIGAPHGGADPASAYVAEQISNRTGAGFVVAYGFKAKRLSVAQPIVRPHPYPVSSDDPVQRGSIFKEYKNILQRTANGRLRFYVGIHHASANDGLNQIEVASSGITFEQARVLKDSFIRIRDQVIGGGARRRISMVMEPLDKISWRVSGVKHHGVLMVSKKGLNLRIPVFSSKADEELYVEILSLWISVADQVLRKNLLRLPQVEVRLMDLGRFELIQSRKYRSGIVVGSPHGSFDEYTAETVKRISYRTGFAAVIAKGFTPTEAGGWRINVNRPTEKTFPSTAFELRTERAREIYETFKSLIFEASKGDLNLYIDVHQYSTDSKIQVATVGVSSEQARVIKMLYREIRDVNLRGRPGVRAVDLIIEPLDAVEIGAWAAKADGILKIAKKSLHFELPAQAVLLPAGSREVYTRILGDLFKAAVAYLLTEDGLVRRFAERKQGEP